MTIPHSQRRKPELLSPAGNLESFFAAVESGADAVYFGLEDFSARAGAQNFSLIDASRAIACARGKSIKVYITLNTLVKTFELEKLINLLTALEEMRPDALIIQDIGLLYLIQSQFPQFNLHASTQMAIHNLAGVKQLERLGFKRVVLARELSVAEIKHIADNTSIELETFIHGALCYSYSGLCFFSSMIGGRSGNRGRCAQPCRVSYHSQSGEKGYFFSMKDLLTLSGISDLVDTGINSFKIEGRMKSPEYVAAVTDAYRHAIDGDMSGTGITADRIKTVFSRETTSAYITGNNNPETGDRPDIVQVKASDIINPSYPANMGLYAGMVVKSENDHIVIRAETDIGVRDLLQIFKDTTAKPDLLHVKTIKLNGKKVFSIKAGDIATINSNKKFLHGAKIYIVSSHSTREVFIQKIPKKLILAKIPVNLDIKINPCNITINGSAMQCVFNKQYRLKTEKSINRETNEEDIKSCFSRLGNTPFEPGIIHVEISEVLFIPLSILNTIRREYFNELFKAWKKDRAQRSEKALKWLKEKIIRFGYSLNKKKSSCDTIHEEKIRLSLKIDRLDYLDYILTKEYSKLYIVLTDQTITYLQENSDIVNTLLRRKEGIVFSLPVIMRDIGNMREKYEYFEKVILSLITQGFRQYQISNLGAMGLFDNTDVILYADYQLYSLNPLSVLKLRELGFHRHTLSPEDDRENLEMLFSDQTDLIIYQDTPLFTSEACVWANMKSACPGINRCGFEQMTLQNEHGDRFVAMNEACRTIVISSRHFSIIHHIPTLLKAGQWNFRIDLCYRRYNPEMIQSIFSAVQDRRKIENSTTGNFERGLL